VLLISCIYTVYGSPSITTSSLNHRLPASPQRICHIISLLDHHNNQPNNKEHNQGPEHELPFRDGILYQRDGPFRFLRILPHPPVIVKPRPQHLPLVREVVSHGVLDQFVLVHSHLVVLKLEILVLDDGRASEVVALHIKWQGTCSRIGKRWDRSMCRGTPYGSLSSSWIFESIP